MLLFHCSQAAVEGLTFTRKGQQRTWVTYEPLVGEKREPGIDWEWHLHQVTIEGQWFWVAMEQQSRFAMLLIGIKKGDGEGLLDCFYQRLANHLYWLLTNRNLLDEQQAESFVQHMLAQLAPVRYLPDSEPGMQADINEVVKVCRLTVAQHSSLFDKEESAAKFDLYLNHLEYQVDKDVSLFPDEQWVYLVQERLAGHHPITGEAVKAAFKAARRNG